MAKLRPATQSQWDSLSHCRSAKARQVLACLSDTRARGSLTLGPTDAANSQRGQSLWDLRRIRPETRQRVGLFPGPPIVPTSRPSAVHLNYRRPRPTSLGSGQQAGDRSPAAWAALLLTTY